jgi:hypothetical protein
MSEHAEQNLRSTLSDIGTRLPQYGRLSARLISDGRMSARKTDPLTGLLAAGGLPLSRLTRMVPMFGYAQQALMAVGAIRFALQEMHPDKADEHLREVGLTRQQVEADFQMISGLTSRFASDGARAASHLVDDGPRAASHLMDDGARKAGRLAGKGFRAFRRWQSTRSSGGDSH